MSPSTVGARALAAPLIAALALAGCSSDERRSLESTPVTTLATSTTSTSSTTTSTSTSTTAAPTTTVRESVLYESVPGPSLSSDRTDEFTADGPLGNGQYWVTYNGSVAANAPFVSLFIAYFGEACVEAAAAFSDECYGDLFVTPTPTRDIDDLPFAADALITVADGRSMSSLRIDAAELELASTGTPSDEAPDGYAYIPFAFLMTVVDGEIVAFEQFRTS